MKKLLLTLTVLLFSANLSYSAVPDSCLKLVFAHDEENLWQSNPDSVCVDSCYGSPTYLKMYANRHYYLNFVDYYYPYDDVLYADDIRTVDEMTDSRPELKSKFQEFESRYGKIYFKGHEDDNVNTNEDTILLSAVIRVIFENYQLIEEIETAFATEIDSLENRSGFFKDYPAIAISVQNNPSESGSMLIYPNPIKSGESFTMRNLPEGAYSIEIFNTLGTQVQYIDNAYGNHSYKLENLPSGMYLLVVRSGAERIVEKIIVY